MINWLTLRHIKVSGLELHPNCCNIVLQNYLYLFAYPGSILAILRNNDCLEKLDFNGGLYGEDSLSQYSTLTLPHLKQLKWYMKYGFDESVVLYLDHSTHFDYDHGRVDVLGQLIMRPELKGGYTAEEHCQQLQIIAMLVDEYSGEQVILTEDQLMSIAARCPLLHTVIIEKNYEDAPQVDYSEVKISLITDTLGSAQTGAAGEGKDAMVIKPKCMAIDDLSGSALRTVTLYAPCAWCDV
eukprot:gene8322-9894_t